jgi:hypothetical protein
MERKVSSFIYWTPRVASILFIIFLSLFSLDVISPELSLSQILLGLVIHNIPVFVLIVVLIISWKYEIVGGIAYIGAGLLYIGMTFIQAEIPWYIALSWSMTIALPSIIIGILFMINWRKKRNKNKLIF